MQYSLSRLNPATLEALRDALDESESVDVFLSKLRKFLSGEGKSIAEQDLSYSTASELSAAGIFDLIPAEQLMSVIEDGEKPKAEAFKKGLAKRYRAELEEIAPKVQVSQASNGRLRNPLVRVRSQGTKKVAGTMTLQVPAQMADPSPPIGPALGQRGISIMEFCKAFNAKTQEIEAGAPIPTVLTYYADKSFTMEIKTPPASYYLKKAAKQRRAGREVDTNSVTVKQVREIAEAKMKDLNVSDVEAAMQIILGSARSIGITVKK